MTTATLTERGICKVCGNRKKLRKNGKIGKHGTCAGAGQKPKKVKPVLTDTKVAVCLDRSGSMHSIRAGAVKAFNTLCEPIKEQGDDYRVSFYTFGGDVKTEWTNKKTKRIPKLDGSNYRAGGGTPLFDTVKRAVENLGDDGVSSYLVIAITDGHENTSSISAAALAKLIKNKQKTDRWTFAFSTPKGHSQQLAKRLGIPIGNFEEWDQTSAGVAGMGQSNRSGVVRYAAARKKGIRSTPTFYAEVNIGREKVGKVAKKLKPVDKNRFRKLKTTASTQIKAFVESKGLTFRKGCAFYKLQKKETVQSYKEIILERKDTSELFGGTAVRNTLGIPEGKNGTVNPGNLGEWNVWVQSTSVNRKLLAKMEVLFDKTK